MDCLTEIDNSKKKLINFFTKSSKIVLHHLPFSFSSLASSLGLLFSHSLSHSLTFSHILSHSLSSYRCENSKADTTSGFLRGVRQEGSSRLMEKRIYRQSERNVNGVEREGKRKKERKERKKKKEKKTQNLLLIPSLSRSCDEKATSCSDQSMDE